MTAYGNWPLRSFAQLAERAEQADRLDAQVTVLQAEVEALRGELEAKDKVLDRIAMNSSCSWSRHRAVTIRNYFRKEEIDG